MRFKITTGLVTLALIAGAAGLTLSLSQGAASASSLRSGALHLAKDCSTEPYGGLAGDYCTITSSNLHAITVGSKVVYTSPMPASGVLDSDIVLVVGPGNTAFGHVHFDVPAGNGYGTFSGGTGEFSDFHATFLISTIDLPTKVFGFDGTYSFSPCD
jgi:hypothetical protein